MKRFIAFTVAAALLVGASLWTKTFAADASVTATSGVHTIELPKLDQKMPPGPGQEVLATACVICHSNRYITMQPPISKTAWKATVDKMRKTFGAPLNDQQAEQIVNYLATVRGTGQP